MAIMSIALHMTPYEIIVYFIPTLHNFTAEIKTTGIRDFHLCGSLDSSPFAN